MHVYDLIVYAYDVRYPSSLYLVGGPDWIRQEYFAVEARASSAATTAQMRLMMQSLLEDPFKLVVRKEEREMRLYSLVRIKDGQLGRNIQPCDRSQTAPPWDKTIRALPPDSRPFAGWCDSSASIASNASRELMAPVVDKTDLAGLWTWMFPFSPERPGAGATETASLTTAIQEELGLKLEAGRGPVQVLVVDSIARPTEN